MEADITKEEVVYLHIGAALVSAQRVEFLAGQLLELLEEAGTIYGIMTEEFMAYSEKSKKIRKKTLGHIFKTLKLNPQLVLSDELDEYVSSRNMLIHGFSSKYLQSKSDKQMWTAIEFCYAFGRFSNRLERFFQGFMYFLSLRHGGEGTDINSTMKPWRESFDYFMESMKHQKLQEIEDETLDKSKLK